MRRAMKANDPRIMSVEQVGETVSVCVCEPDREGPATADMTGREAEDLAIKLMTAGRSAQAIEYDRIQREEDDILRRARMIWIGRHGSKPFLPTEAE